MNPYIILIPLFILAWIFNNSLFIGIIFIILLMTEAVLIINQDHYSITELVVIMFNDLTNSDENDKR